METRFLKLSEAAPLLNLSLEQAKRLIEQGIMPARRVEGEWVISSEVVARFARGGQRRDRQQKLRGAAQKVGGLGAQAPIESTATFDLSVLDELDPPGF